MGACSIGDLEAEHGVAVTAVEGPRCQAWNKESHDFSRVECQQNVYIAVPNSYIIRNPIINENLIDPRKSSYFEITISYDSDIDYAMSFIKERLKSDERVLDRDDFDVSCVRLKSNGAVIRTVIAARTSYDAFDIETDLRKAIFKEISMHHRFAIAPARIEIVKHQH